MKRTKQKMMAWILTVGLVLIPGSGITAESLRSQVRSAKPAAVVKNQVADVQMQEEGFQMEGTVLTDFPKNQKELYIPEKIGGKPVEEIDENLFTYAEITKISLPETLKKIGDFAFTYCDDLKEIEFRGKKVPEMGSTVFEGLEGVRIVCDPSILEELQDTISDASNGDLDWVREWKTTGSAPVVDKQEGEEVWNLNEEGVLLSYTGKKTDLIVPRVIGGKLVKKIGKRAFEGKPLQKITLPEGLEEIQKEAFQNCRKLESVEFPKSLRRINESAFFLCTSLKNVHLPDSLESLGADSFKRCDSLTSITIPAQVQHLNARDEDAPNKNVEGDLAFLFCEKLQEILVSKDNPYFCSLDGVLLNRDKTVLLRYPDARPNLSYTIPEGVQEIAPSAFKLSNTEQGKEYLREVKFPKSLSRIGTNAFMQQNLRKIQLDPQIKLGKFVFNLMRGLEEIAISEGVEEIPEGTFYGLDDFRGKLTLPSTLKRIGARAFERLGLSEIHLPEGLEEIGADAFALADIQNLHLPASLQKVGDRAFYLCKKLEKVDFEPKAQIKDLGRYTFTHCPQLKTVQFPEGLTVLEDGVLSACASLDEVEVPSTLKELKNHVFALSGLTACPRMDSVQKMGHGTYRGCSKLKKGDLPPHLQTWGFSTFENCFNMEDVEIPSSVQVQSIPYDTFFSCRSLKGVQLPPVIGSTEACAFSNCTADGFFVDVKRYKKDFHRNLFDCYPIDPGSAYETTENTRENGEYLITKNYKITSNFSESEGSFKDLPSDRPESGRYAPNSKFESHVAGATAYRKAASLNNASLCQCATPGALLVIQPTAHPHFTYLRNPNAGNLSGDGKDLVASDFYSLGLRAEETFIPAEKKMNPTDKSFGSEGLQVDLKEANQTRGRTDQLLLPKTGERQFKFSGLGIFVFILAFAYVWIRQIQTRSY